MKPILFSTDMVRALLKGCKTQTRRVMKPQPVDISGICEHQEGFHPIGGNLYECGDCGCRIKSRYQTGDILWVREAFCPNYFDDYSPAYKADYYKEGVGDVLPEPKWKPGIHMPQTAARIFLRITDVKPERLQDISEKDAEAEGVITECPYEHIVYGGDPFGTNIGPVGTCYSEDDCRNPMQMCQKDNRELFACIWDEIDAKHNGGQYAWDKNPWVWVYTFERIHT